MTTKVVVLFLTEALIVNTAPIVLGAGFVAYLFGPFLFSAGVGWKKRRLLYAVAGAGAGLWTYSALDIPERSFHPLEALGLSISMFFYAYVIVWGSFVLKNRRSKKCDTNTLDVEG